MEHSSFQFIYAVKSFEASEGYWWPSQTLPNDRTSPLLGGPQMANNTKWSLGFLALTVTSALSFAITSWLLKPTNSYEHSMRVFKGIRGLAYDTSFPSEDDIACGVRPNSALLKDAGGPYLYISFHGGAAHHSLHNVCKYTLNGTPLGAALLNAPSEDVPPPIPPLINSHSEFRGLLLLNNGELLINDSWRQASRVVRATDCDKSIHGKRKVVGSIVHKTAVPPLIHPYGIAISKHSQELLVTTQGTSQLLRYPFQEKGLASDHFFALQGPKGGVLYSSTPDAVRGVVVDREGIIYVADKWHGVRVLNDTDSRPIDTIDAIERPTALWYSGPEQHSLYVGCTASQAVYEVDLRRRGRILQVFMHHRLIHPAGMVGYGKDLFVLSQDRVNFTKRLLKFDRASGKFLGTIISHLPDDGEGLLLSPC